MAEIERCLTHRKPFEKVCAWCGTRVCPMCVAAGKGNKVYCERCAGRLGDIKPQRIPPPPRREQQQQHEPEPYY